MGTSFVEYKGFGFWTRDWYLETWLEAMIREMPTLPVPGEWQQSLIEHWRTQIIVDGGTMSIGLDDFVIDEGKKQLLLDVARKALPNAPTVGSRTGELFIGLLEGSLKTTASSPIDYLSDPRSHESSQ